jgi:hypothetical protein
VSLRATSVCAFITTTAVAFVVISALGDRRGTPQSRMAGTVLEFHPGEWLSFTNEQTDPTGIRITLRDTTVYEGAAIEPGAVVTVWYRSVAERRPVADKVHVISKSEWSSRPSQRRGGPKA